ncbi:hypothetical protein ILUMI_22502 [Ignelater luminosus]|uniref:Uncharacterized protein n=1 Tax=Ignelater luminosus TaxID=2038154 RepID=A0A8K0CGM3_IGNLU|nr:hypothetical protein ILUMI_22502 [Ignelater luminosus]
MALQNNQQSSHEILVESNDSGTDIYNNDTYYGNGYIEVSPGTLIDQNQEIPARYTSPTVESDEINNSNYLELTPLQNVTRHYLNPEFSNLGYSMDISFPSEPPSEPFKKTTQDNSDGHFLKACVVKKQSNIISNKKLKDIIEHRISYINESAPSEENRYHKPKKDQCSNCESYKNSNKEERKQSKESYDKHLKEKELYRKEKAEDVEDAKTDKNKMVAMYDLQAVLPTPSEDISTFYYKSKLATYISTVYEIVPKQGYCYIWNETCAKRGANEIGTWKSPPQKALEAGLPKTWAETVPARIRAVIKTSLILAQHAYTNEELMNMMIVYRKVEQNAATTARLYAERFPGQIAPHPRGFGDAIQHPYFASSLLFHAQGIRPSTSTTSGKDGNEVDVNGSVGSEINLGNKSVGGKINVDNDTEMENRRLTYLWKYDQVKALIASMSNHI